MGYVGKGGGWEIPVLGWGHDGRYRYQGTGCVGMLVETGIGVGGGHGNCIKNVHTQRINEY